jgi:hypothetical protein
MDRLLKVARKALQELLEFLRRFINNTPRNDYEEIVISAARAVAIRYGRF